MLPRVVFLFDRFRSCECAAVCCRDPLELVVNPPYDLRTSASRNAVVMT